VTIVLLKEYLQRFSPDGVFDVADFEDYPLPQIVLEFMVSVGMVKQLIGGQLQLLQSSCPVIEKAAQQTGPLSNYLVPVVPGARLVGVGDIDGDISKLGLIRGDLNGSTRNIDRLGFRWPGSLEYQVFHRPSGHSTWKLGVFKDGCFPSGYVLLNAPIICFHTQVVPAGALGGQICTARFDYELPREDSWKWYLGQS
jgi:hypothetical protein